MRFIMVSEDELQRWETILKEIEKHEVDALVRSDLGDGFNFEEVRPLFENITKLYKGMKSISLQELPKVEADERINKGQEVLTELNNFRNITFVGMEKPSEKRQEMVTNLQSLYDNIFKTSIRYIAYSVATGQELTELAGRATNANDEAQKILAQMNSMRSEAKEVLRVQKKATETTVIERHAGLFEEEARKFKNSGYGWLAVTTAIALVLLYFAYWNIDYYSTTKIDLTVARSIQLGLAKVIAFSILYFGLILASRNYRAVRHNHVVNKHRVNALGTFEAFVQSTKHEPTQNAVLIRSTETIFSPSSTGYLGKEEERSGNTSILEIVREALGKNSE